MSCHRVAFILALFVLGAIPTSATASISGTVYFDYNSNGVKDTGGYVAGSGATATDAPVENVQVSAYDATGARVSTTTTAADGSYSLCGTGCSGTVRVEFGTPTANEPSFAGSQNGTSVRFVATDATGVDYAVTNAVDYCQDNPDLMTCLQQATGMVGNPSYAARPGAFRTPAAFYGAADVEASGMQWSAWPRVAVPDSAIVAPFSSIGATFGVGVDRMGNAYYGTYVKRHSPYGPAGGVNAIYRVNIATGTTSTFVVLGNATLPAHVQATPTGWPDYAADGYRADNNASDVYHLVGRAGLGDVDVTQDGRTMLAVEMTQGAPKLWRVPIDGTGNTVSAGTATSVSIPVPSTFGSVTCVGNWHPMGIGIRGDRILVGGVCGGTETQWVANPADTTVNSRTNAAAFILEFDTAASAFQTIAAFSLAYPKGSTDNDVYRMYAWDNVATGFWHNWNDGVGVGSTPGEQVPRSQPMLANIEIMDDGDLVLAFRDRANDQTKSGSIGYESSSASPVRAKNAISAAEFLRLCLSGPGSYVRESNGACGAQTGANYPPQMSGVTGSPTPASLRADSPLYYLGYVTGWNANDGHSYISQGGAASKPGTPYLWTSVYDPEDYTSQGLRAYGPCAARSGRGVCGPAGAADGAVIGVAELGWGTYGWPSNGGTAYGKGNALGDLEIVCDAAPVQIGNRIWIDSNKDGIQDPGEPVVAGVTVRLYDVTGVLVGTAVTDASGTYYFSSNISKAATGDGSNTGGGLVAGAAFKVALDNPTDYAVGGPLHGYTLTTANVAAQGTAVNSKATMVGGYPTIDIPSRAAGQNNHTFDVGFYPPASDARSATSDLVAIGDYTWIDTNRNGVQDAGEKPLRGVRVTLLTPDGKRAKDAAGKVVPVKRTDAKGYYVFDGLKPGRYKVQFVLPSGYRFTASRTGSTKRDSNPRASSDNPLRGVTPVFRVYAAVKGNTIRNRNTKLNASFIDPTIDAGVVRYAPTPVPSRVTG